MNAVIQKTREMRRGVYYPHLYVVKEDGEPPLRLWALSALIQDRADVLPSYQQFIGQLKDKVSACPSVSLCERVSDLGMCCPGQRLRELLIRTMRTKGLAVYVSFLFTCCSSVFFCAFGNDTYTFTILLYDETNFLLVGLHVESQMRELPSRRLHNWRG